MFSVSRFKFARIIDRTSFTKLFMAWLCIIFLFGVVYFVFSALGTSQLFMGNTAIPPTTEGLFDSIYFSFITATTLGYGDVVPVGILKLFAIMEAVFGFIAFGVMISKLMSTKQEVVLEEIYDIAFEENIDRLRGSLYSFREDINYLIHKVENKNVTQREIDDLWIQLTTLDTALVDMDKLLCPLARKDETASYGYQYYKKVEGIRLELLFNSLRHSLDKLQELLSMLNKQHLNWQNTTVIKSINQDLKLVTNMLAYYERQEKTDAKTHEMLQEIKDLKNKVYLEIAAYSIQPGEKEAQPKPLVVLAEVRP